MEAHAYVFHPSQVTSKNIHTEKSHKLILLLLLFFSCCMGEISTDMEILLAFKHQCIASDPNNALGGWNSSTPLCNWPGISCADDQARVLAIQLSGLGLSGIIPPLLSNLSSLRLLDLSNNSFHGLLPEHLGHLSLLRHLRLHYNSLTGTIPHTLSNCSNLEEIHFAYNELYGNLPPSLGLLTKLKILVVSANNLAGAIPPSFGNLSSLIYLYLPRNRLSGDIPEELGGLHNLIRLHISVNQLTGTIPSLIYNISSIELFSVTSNKLIGQLPKDIGFRFPKLHQIYMGANQFTGPIPSSLSNISGIQDLDLSRNRFQGSLPLLGNMRNLLTLNLGINRLSSSTELNKLFFDSLTNCTLLEGFSVSKNQLAGFLPVSTANLSIHLEGFNIDVNLFTGSFPMGMHNYRNLTMLDLGQNSFVGSIPKSLASLKNLRMLSLSLNGFVGEIPDIFSNLTSLYLLNLSDNHFSGRISRSIGDCQHLGMLDLSGNNLSGSIPEEIFNLRSLTFNLSLARNFLTGFLPVEVGNLDKLLFMNLSDNQLSGSVPVTIGRCASLQKLELARNRFEGPIPESLGELIALEGLDLSWNHLTGEIPGGLEKLEYLQNMKLSFNDLQGLVPTDGVFMNLSWSSLQGNKGLCSDNRVTRRQLKISRCGRSSSIALKIAIPIAGVAALFGFLLCLKYIVDSKTQGLKVAVAPAASYIGQHRKISYKEISSATDNFSLRNLIGKGSFGSVYKGILRVQNTITDVVAIKVFDLTQSKVSSFAAECETLGSIRHRNLVKIITSCSSMTHSGTEFKAIVMKFMSNGSLDKWLHPENPSMPRLELLQRLNISIDVAAAMDYLHHDCDPPVVHCDLKPSNVLLDDEMIAHVGDFGLARILSQTPSQSQNSTLGLKGSIGYIAPEYNYGSKVSTRGDVYSYGILLLEIFTGKKPTDEMFKDGFNLKNFASKVSENRVYEIVDKSLLEGGNDYEVISNTSRSNNNDNTSGSSSENMEWWSRKEECLAALIQLALSCASDFPKNRPSMREALTRMHGIKESLLWSN